MNTNILHSCFPKSYVCNIINKPMKDFKHNDYKLKLEEFMDYFYSKNILTILVDSITKTKELNQKTNDIPLIEHMIENKINIYNSSSLLRLSSYYVRRFLVSCVQTQISWFSQATSSLTIYDTIRDNFNLLLEHFFKEFLLATSDSDQKEQKKKTKKIEAITIVI